MGHKDPLVRKEYHRQYDLAHKSERNLHVDCDCGGRYLMKHRAKHFSTQMHTSCIKRMCEFLKVFTM
ncbi:hypothetical protein T484DRAFT_1966118 [Baffinella frigidus]|nr:hypothetical protein T484DRAFT_1966118 [Cryptophyta sp. CCMP2293]